MSTAQEHTFAGNTRPDAVESVTVEHIPGLVWPEGQQVAPTEAADDAPESEAFDFERGRTFLGALFTKAESKGAAFKAIVDKSIPVVFEVYAGLQAALDLARADLDETLERIRDLRDPAKASAQPDRGDGWVQLGPVPARTVEVDDEAIGRAHAMVQQMQQWDWSSSKRMLDAIEDVEIGLLFLEQEVASVSARLDEARAELEGLSAKDSSTPAVEPIQRDQAQFDHDQFRLDDDQIRFFEENGYLGPLTLCSEAEMGRIRRWMDRVAFLHGSSPIYDKARGGRILRDWHLVHRELYDLCSHPALVEAMASIFGPNLLLWRSQFMLKEMGYGPVAWHQDGAFPGSGMQFALSEAKNVSVWIAIDEATIDNGCVRVVPGSHREELDYSGGGSEVGAGLFNRKYQVSYVVDPARAKPMVLKPGQFFIFDGKTLHGSTHNPSVSRRLGLSLRFTTPDVKVYEDQEVDSQGYSLEKFGCVLVRGEDTTGNNVLTDPPKRG